MTKPTAAAMRAAEMLWRTDAGLEYMAQVIAAEYALLVEASAEALSLLDGGSYHNAPICDKLRAALRQVKEGKHEKARAPNVV